MAEKPAVEERAVPRRVAPDLLKYPLSPRDKALYERLKMGGPLSPDEELQRKYLEERGAVPAELTPVGQARLEYLRSKTQLSPERAARLKRLKVDRERRDLTLSENLDLRQLMGEGPRTEDEDEEMALLEQAGEERRKYDAERSAAMEKIASGPFTIEQWRHLTSYIQAAIMHRTSHGGVAPPHWTPPA